MGSPLIAKNALHIPPAPKNPPSPDCPNPYVSGIFHDLPGVHSRLALQVGGKVFQHLNENP